MLRDAPLALEVVVGIEYANHIEFVSKSLKASYDPLSEIEIPLGYDQKICNTTDGEDHVIHCTIMSLVLHTITTDISAHYNQVIRSIVSQPWVTKVDRKS